MKRSIPNGGPAYPTNVIYSHKTGGFEYGPEGISVRDYFAAAALQGMMATRKEGFPTFHPQDDATFVYRIADAMLKARQETTTTTKE